MASPEHTPIETAPQRNSLWQSIGRWTQSLRWPRVLAIRPLRSAAAAWRSGAIDLLFPPQCLGCNEELPDSPPIPFCNECRATLFPAVSHSCPRCAAASLAPVLPGGCDHCRKEKFAFDRVFALGTYSGELREAVLRIKQPQSYALALALGAELGRHVASQGTAFPEATLEPRAETLKEAGRQPIDFDAVAPMPMVWRRHVWRGVNAPELLAERASRELGLPCYRNLLAYRRTPRRQSQLSPARRRRNLRGALQVSSSYRLRQARILFVDDILTTGATASEAARALKAAGAAAVGVAVIARGIGIA